MNELEKRVKSGQVAFLTYAAGIVSVALGAIVIYALAVLDKITSLENAVWALVILGVVGMVLVTEGVLARSRHRELQKQAQEKQVTNVRLSRSPKLYPRDIRDSGNVSNEWRM